MDQQKEQKGDEKREGPWANHRVLGVLCFQRVFTHSGRDYDARVECCRTAVATAAFQMFHGLKFNVFLTRLFLCWLDYATAYDVLFYAMIKQKKKEEEKATSRSLLERVSRSSLKATRKSAVHS